MSADALVFNGINGATGEYLYSELALDKLEDQLGRPPNDAHAQELRYARDANEPHYGLVHRLDAETLAEAGWGVVVPSATPACVTDALAPLLERRRSEAEERYYEIELAPGTSKQAFLAQRGMGPGPANPAKVPYYLLLVGGPEAIPYRFQYELDAQYAVGRLAFDTSEEYRSYAETVVAAEQEEASARPSMHLFGPRHSNDRASILSAGQLVRPLADELTTEARGWTIAETVGDGATKTHLMDLLFAAGAPDILLTAGHGIGFETHDPRRLETQGALVTQDWPGPKHGISEQHYLAGGDVPADRPVRTRVVFSFACFVAGSPATGDAPAFVARLPQKLLGTPAGGALAFVGHVDRAVGYSFAWPDVGAQRDHFCSALLALTDGWRVGHAKEYFDERYMDVTVTLNEVLDRIRKGEIIDPVDLAGLWTASQDARNYLVLGDPAVRLPGHRDRSEGLTCLPRP